MATILIAGQLVPCTKALCPYATMETLLNGSQVLINTAPYVGFASYSGYVNAYSDPDYQQAAYKMFSAVSSYALSFQVGGCGACSGHVQLVRDSWLLISYLCDDGNSHMGKHD